MTTPTQTLPQAFILRRVHSLTGLWLAVYIIFHLYTNSQAGLLIGEDGRGFIDAVNSIHALPFLPLIEITVLGFPIFIHMWWGIKYLRTAKYNSFPSDGSRPSLTDNPRNQAYTWQRITAWLLVLGVIAHVVHMRFIDHPMTATHDHENSYVIRISTDAGLSSLAERLGVDLYDWNQVQQTSWLKALHSHPLKAGEMVAVAKDFGTAELLVVRDTFKMPFMLVLYTLFVLAACYHAFNGLWTFMISWGIALTQRSQQLMRIVSTALMLAVGSLGLAAVWLTYWINLKQ